MPDEPRGDVGYERILTSPRGDLSPRQTVAIRVPYQRAHYERLAAEVTTTGEKATWLPGANRDPTAMYEASTP